MAAKRKRTAGISGASMVSNAAEAVGKALGTAVSTLESAVGTRRKAPNGYQKLKARGQQADRVADRPARSRKTGSTAKPKTGVRGRSTRSGTRKAR